MGKNTEFYLTVVGINKGVALLGNEEFSENVTPGQRKIQDLFIINLFPKKEIVFSKMLEVTQ